MLQKSRGINETSVLISVSKIMLCESRGREVPAMVSGGDCGLHKGVASEPCLVLLPLCLLQIFL